MKQILVLGSTTLVLSEALGTAGDNPMMQMSVCQSGSLSLPLLEPWKGVLGCGPASCPILSHGLPGGRSAVRSGTQRLCAKFLFFIVVVSFFFFLFIFPGIPPCSVQLISIKEWGYSPRDE